MSRGVLVASIMFFLSILIFHISSGSCVELDGAMDDRLPRYRIEHRRLLSSASISARQMDITTPIMTVPTPNPTAGTDLTDPVVNPAVTDPDSPTANPITSPGKGYTSGSWCVSSQSASQTALQVALDYACGYGGADCSAIQPGGRCYNPNTIRDHASYAFNSYYHKYPIPNSCNFGGTAIATSTDPSSGTCQYPSTSTSSSVLNTTNSIGAKVFGSGPINPSPTGSGAATMRATCLHIAIASFYTMMLPRNHP